MATTAQVDSASKTSDQLNPMRKSNQSMEALKNPVCTKIKNTTLERRNVELTSKHENTPKTSTQPCEDPESIASVTLTPNPSQNGSGPGHKYATRIYFNSAQTTPISTQVEEDGYQIVDQGRVVVFKRSQLDELCP